MVVGIDPGKSGAIVHLNARGELEDIWDMPDTDMTLRAFLSELVSCRCPIWIEQIPKFTGKPQSGSSVATLFSNYRYIVGYLDAHEANLHQVIPQVWMKPYRLGTPNWAALTYSRRKKRLHDLALNIFETTPQFLTRRAADAALIAFHGYVAHGESK